MTHTPAKQGLYDPAFEHDACGVAFVVDMHGRRTHAMVRRGLDSLCNLDHRGATGAEDNVGDGAGILTQIPDELFRAVCGFELPPAGQYAVGIGFLPQDPAAADKAADAIAKIVDSEGLRVLGWRDLPIDDSMIGRFAQEAEPTFRQLFVVGADGAPLEGIALERRCFILRKRLEHEVEGVYFPSLSGRTIVYKGMLTTPQLQRRLCAKAEGTHLLERLQRA